MKADWLEKLAKPFEVHKIKWRVTRKKKGDDTRGCVIPYVDARDVMQRLDVVVGPLNWQNDYTDGGSGRLTCGISISTPGGWLRKSDGAGGREPSKTGKGLSEAEANKADYSEAFKRTAVCWKIARCLYWTPEHWVDLDEWGYPLPTPPCPSGPRRKAGSSCGRNTRPLKLRQKGTANEHPLRRTDHPALGPAVEVFHLGGAPLSTYEAVPEPNPGGCRILRAP